jgi:hypothetical protein
MASHPRARPRRQCGSTRREQPSHPASCPCAGPPCMIHRARQHRWMPIVSIACADPKALHYLQCHAWLDDMRCTMFTSQNMLASGCSPRNRCVVKIWLLKSGARAPSRPGVRHHQPCSVPHRTIVSHDVSLFTCPSQNIISNGFRDAGNSTRCEVL